ncbi:MAG: aldehyde dehydrogenase family protein [Peptococcaceae bacterium]|nr:aldehyde dehydrogenase family protein [Peptococcaceae bacterium]
MEINTQIEIKTRTYRNYINGEWSDAANGAIMEARCPSDGQVVSIAPKSSAADVDRAARAARAAFERADWAYNPRSRSNALYAWAQKLRERGEDVARILSAEAGKPISEARFETGNAINYLEYSAASARKLYGGATNVDATSFSILAREPVGVVGAILPWNYPVTLFMRDMTPALAAGCATVVKPAAQTSGCAMILLELLHETGMFPAGVINALTGAGSEAGEALINHKDVDMITFTGGTAVGQHIMRTAADTMKKVSLELGGKAGNIVFADADMDKVMANAVRASFSNAGQLCTVASRLILEKKAAPTFLPAYIKLVEALRIGHSLAEDTQLGPVVNQTQLESVLGYINEAKSYAKLLTGGNRVTASGLDKGYFIEPTIFLDPPAGSRLAQDEIFGPVLVVQTFETLDEAIALANNTPYGLASGVWSKDIDKAMRVAREMKAGSCWVNCYNRLFPDAETGGYKLSGTDRAAGIEGLMKYTEVKHICIDFSAP